MASVSSTRSAPSAPSWAIVGLLGFVFGVVLGASALKIMSGGSVSVEKVIGCATSLSAPRGVFEEAMMISKIVVAASLVAAFSMPAFAATEYWVAKDAATKKCQVVDKKPDGKKMTDVGTKMYASQANAERALKELGACK
ncbi:hypothetical protein [Mesorhizobium sp. KR1-2]|uniref:hypothetical protein n=1 Tax=Mesorhizobium sp. KR1-2 TaxID=3156609 RepID=UPI0032B390C8